MGMSIVYMLNTTLPTLVTYHHLIAPPREWTEVDVLPRIMSYGGLITLLEVLMMTCVVGNGWEWGIGLVVVWVGAAALGVVEGAHEGWDYVAEGKWEVVGVWIGVWVVHIVKDGLLGVNWWNA